MVIRSFCSRLFILWFALLWLSACGGGGGGGSSDKGSQEPTGSSSSGQTDAPSSGGSDENPDGADAGGDQTDPDRATGDSTPAIPPVLASLLTDQGLIGPGRIIDSTISFMGTGQRGAVVQLYLNGDLAGSSMTRSDGSWTLDYSVIALDPGTYTATLMSVASNGVETPSAAPFVFVYDPSAPLAPVISGITADSATALDGITNDNTLLVAGTAEPGSTLELFLNGVQVASTTVDDAGNWLVDYSAVTLADGIYTLSAESIYMTLRSATSAQFPLVVDTQNPLAPVIAAITPDTGVSSVDGITSGTNLSLAGTAEPGATVRVQLNNVIAGSTTADGAGNWIFNYAAVTLGEGNYAFSAFQLDRAGNSSVMSAPIAVQVDTTPPLPVSAMTFGPDSGVIGDSITAANALVFSGTATPGDWVQVDLAGVQIGMVQVDGSGNWALDYTGTTLADATHVVTTYTQDVAGNVSVAPAVMNVIVDTVAPVAPLISSFAADSGILGDQLTADTTPLFAGSAEPDSTVTVQVNGIASGTTVADGAGAWQYDMTGAPLVSGLYAVTATATDAAGNESVASAVFNLAVDTIPPAAPSVLAISPDTGTLGDGVTGVAALTVNGVAEAGAAVAVLLDGAVLSTVTADGGGNWSLDNTAALIADGNHQLTAQAQDAAGNLSPVSSPFALVVDTAALATPVISGVNADSGVVGDAITNVPNLVFNGTAAAGSSILFLVNALPVGTVLTDGSGNWSFDHSGVTLADATHAISVVSTNLAGVSVTSAVYSLTVDTVAPAAPVLTAWATDTGVNGDAVTADGALVFSGTAEAGSTLYFSVGATDVGTAPVDGAGNWSFDYSATVLVDGVYSFTAAAMDVAGNRSVASSALVVTVDTGIPAAPVVASITTDTGTPGDGITSDNTLVIVGTAEADAIVNVLIDAVSIGTVTADGSGNWSFDHSGTTLADGSYVITAVASDGAGNSSIVSAPFPFAVDVVAPAAPLVGAISADSGTPGDGITSDNTLMISGTAQAGASVNVRIDAVSIGTATADGSGNWSLDYTGTTLADGSYGITAIASDNAGNASAVSAVFNITIDTGVPAAPADLAVFNDSGTGGDGVTSDNTLLIGGTAEANASIDVLIDGVSVGTATADGSGNWIFDYSGTVLPDDTYALTARVTDSAGNTSVPSAVLNVIIDTVAPATPAVITFSTDSGAAGDGITNDSSLAFTGTAEADVMVSVLIDGGFVGSTTADGAGNWSFDYTGTALGDATYAVTAAAEDDAGNISVTSAALNVTVDTGVPAAPVVTAITADTGTAGDGITSDNTLVINGTSEGNASIDVLINAVAIGTVTADGSGNWSLDYTGTALPDSSHAITATATDSAANTSATSAAFSIIIDTGIPAAPVVTTITSDTGTPADGITSDNTLVIGGTSEANASINVLIDAVSIGTATADGSGNWSFNHTGTTLADNSYAITAIASDNAGNTSVASATFSITIDSGVPAAPAITAITTDTGSAGDGITSDNTLVFTGTAEANIQISVLIDAVAVGSTTADGSGNWSLDYTGTTLADNSYVVTAVSSDSAGNASVASAPFNITVDTGVPAAPAVTTITTDSGTPADGITNDNTLVINGTSEANASINVLIDAVSIGTATADGSGNWSFNHTGTTLADNSYAITATASDSAGNTSAASAAFNITIDTGVPAVPAVTAFTADTGAAGDGITGDNTLVFSGTAQASVSVNVLIDAVSIGTATADGSGNWSFDHSAVVLADNTYAITATASDGAGNTSAASAALTVTVDAQAPGVSSLTPADSATGVGLTQNLIIQFDETVQVGSGNIVIRHFIDDTVFETIPVGDARVTGGGTTTLTVNPAASFVGGTQYYVEIAAGALVDAAGNGFAGYSGNGNWTFTALATSLIATTPADEATNVALATSLTFTFSEAVTANVGNVLIRRISDDSIVDTIDLSVASVGGDGTDTLVLNQNGTLDPNTAYYVEIEAGAFINGNNVAFAGISGNSALNFTTLNAAVPAVTNVTSSIADGTYRGGDSIPIQVQFSAVVNVTGTPQIYIDLDGADKYINYSAGSGSNVLQFDYLVATGDSTADLEYVSSAALVLNGGTIRSADSANASLTLFNPGAAGSLGTNKNIAITAAALDITNIDASDGFLIEGSEASTVYFGHSVSGGGDFNGDGFEDLAIGVPDSNIFNTSGGYAYLVYGQAGATRANLAMSAFAGSDGIYVTGAAGTDRLGSVVDISGDLNGDGYDDFVLVSSQADAAASNSGTAYVVWGSASPANIDIATFNTSDGFTNANGFVIAGYESSEELGYFLSSDPRNAQYLDASGDFNGDGIDDLLIGHDRSNINGADSGMSYLVFGQTGATRANIRLDTYTAGFQFFTSAGSDVELGHSVQYIGDFNGDGRTDVLLGAPQADGGATDSGEAYVVFGHAGPVFSDVDVAALDGTNGFTISTSNSNAQLGGSVASADLNGDGLTDLIIGAPEADTASRTNNGAAIVLYGNTGSPYSDIDLAAIPAGAGFLIHGENATDRVSWSVRGTGDINGDGIDDFMLSTVHDDEGGTSAGAAWVIFGRTGTARGTLDLATLSSSDGFKIIGDVAGDDFGKSATAGDINGDGYQDMMISSVAGDNAGGHAGEVNVIWGKDFSAVVFAGLTGNASANNLVGTSGADTITGGGGADTVSAGAGNDLIRLADLSFTRVDGGRGTDTLELTGSGLSLDLRTRNIEVIQGIEIINLGDRGNGLSLDKTSLVGLSDEVRTLYVRGGSRDGVATDGSETWVANGTVVVDTITYNRYDLDLVSLFVQQQLSQPVTPAAPAISGYATDTGTPGDGITTDNRLVFSGTTGAYFEVEVLIGAVSAGTTTANAAGAWTFDHSARVLADAVYSITARATNLGGYTSVASAALTITIDTTAPAAPVVTAITSDTATAADGITGDNTLLISGTAEANASVNVLIDAVSIGTATADGSGNWSFDHTGTVLADGLYAITAIASDAAGNTSAASAAFSVRIDTGIPGAPVITGIASDNGIAGDGITNDTSLTLSGTAEANASIQVLQDGAVIGTTVANGAGNWTYFVIATLAEGNYSFTAIALDSAGNTSVASAGYAVTIDTTAPTVSSLSPADAATGVLPDANLVITFASAVYGQTGNITIRRASDNGIFEQIPVGDARITGSGTNTITVNPTATLVGGTDYYVQIDATAFDDLTGNSYAGISDTTSWNFTSQGLLLTSSAPADDATGVALNSAFVLYFNTAAIANTGNIRFRQSSDDSVFETIAVNSPQVTGTGTTSVMISPYGYFEPDTSYYIQIDAGTFVSGSGASFAGINDTTTLNFTTANPPVPTVTNVTSSTANGTYGVGDVINVQVQFSELVNITLGTPYITLDLAGTDRAASYVSGSGTTTLNFSYTVKFGDVTPDLDFVATTALNANGADLRSALFVRANLTLPSPGAAGSLGANRNIVIDASDLDLSTLSSADGFQVQGSTAGEHLGWAVKGVGDVNGDGFEDLLAGAPYNSSSTGVAYIVFGQAGATRSNINTSAINNGTNGFRITGQSAFDYLSASIGGAGDINDDGYDDLYVAAPQDDDYGSNAGILYVIYGRASPTNVAISSFSSSIGFRVTTSEVSAGIGDSFTGYTSNGQAVDAGGDFNGDGVQDLVLGIRLSDEDGADSGKAYVIFGRAGSTRTDVNLDTIDPTGTDGVLIYGSTTGWQLGQAAQFVGDYDADGFDDVVVGAIYADATGTDAGQAHLIFGSHGPVFNAVDVGSLGGASGFTIASSSNFGVLGHSVAGGDFNGDGIHDLFVSQNGYGTNAGAGYVIYGNDSGGVYPDIDVDTMPGSTGYGIFGQSVGEYLGHSLADAGDFNADGIDDLLIASYLRDDGGADSGVAWLINGQDGTARADLGIAALSPADGFKISGGGIGDHFGQSTAAADMNGDGFSDLILGATWGDNASIDGGETVVLWGREFVSVIASGLTGTAGADNLVGTSGNDTLTSNGGADAISTGAGNDTILLADTGFYRIDGGEGTDTLQFVTTLNNLDLSAIAPERIRGIEVINLADSSNTLQVTKEGVQGLSREGRALYVHGGGSDVVTSTSGDAWCYTGTRVINTITYHVYLDNGAILYIQNGIDHSGVGNFTSTQQYTFRTTAAYASVAGAVTNVPMLIRVSNTIRDSLQAGRIDIRFTDRDQITWLPYEIEIGASNELYAWVLVPQVDGNSTSDYIVMHYNDRVNGSVPDRQNPPAVWFEYAGVWHFDEGSGNSLDATAYQNSGTQTGTVSRVSYGVGRGAQFNSTTERFTVPSDITTLLTGKPWTLMLMHDFPGCTGFGWNSPIANIASMGGNWSLRSANIGFFGNFQGPKATIGGASMGGGIAASWWASNCDGHLALVYNPSDSTESRFYWGGQPVRHGCQHPDLQRPVDHHR